MERVDQVKQSFLDFIEHKSQLNSFPASWTSSGDACSALSKSSPSAAISSDGKLPYNALGHPHSRNICESSTQSGPLLKEHDYIGLAEASSSCSSVTDNGISDAEDTDLRLGRGPAKEELCSLQLASQHKAQPLLELELLDPKDKSLGPPITGVKNGFKRAYGEMLGEISRVNMASAIVAPVTQSHRHAQQNVFLSNWPAPNSNVIYVGTDANELRSYESASTDPPPAKGQVVGWPPIRTYRRNALTVTHSELVLDVDRYSAVYVKVNMDGIPIGRKVDLNVYRSYESLLAALEEMFYSPSSGDSAHFLSNGEFALTYEDKEGDWMLVGDLPWGMFVNTIRRLRIVRGSDANGLAPR